MLHFSNVSKKFRQTEVLSNINLDINEGERVALVGANGAGKTTLIRCLLGEYHYQGSITIGDLEPRRHRRQVLSGIGFVPQHAPPLKISVKQFVGFTAGVCDIDSAAILNVSARLGLDLKPIWHQSFNKLSGGQKQKLLISIALGRNCTLLVLDEPTANLDPQARHVFFQILAEQQERCAMLLSSHRLYEVSALVNRVVELDQGQILLNDHVVDQVDMAGTLDCLLASNRLDSAFSQAVEKWGFSDSNNGLQWHGQIPAPERLRFLSMLSR